MRPILIVLGLVGLLAGGLGEAAAAAPDPDPTQQPTAGSHGSITARRGPAPNISPNDPAYAENGAPRRGQPSGYDTAGAPSANGNYAPIQHRHTRRR
ncbi:MAG: hypothetical protein HY060_22610 [Proteobacteria bacterium]|nr:hypothetical protein [Pseudomonadota bacterium]